MLLWGYVQSVFCIYKLEHLFYETVMQFYYQCELKRFLNVHSWVCFLIPKPKFEEAGPCINKCNYWTLLKWLKLQKHLSDNYTEIINDDNFIYRMNQHILIADRLRQVVFRWIKNGLISNKANEFKNSQVVVVITEYHTTWGLLRSFIFNSFPVYSNTPLLMNSYPYFWWFMSDMLQLHQNITRPQNELLSGEK